MIPTPVKTFIHPAKVYRLEFPAHWDQVQQDEGRSCGFGPHERDDVGLWISIMPMSIDTERLEQDLPKLMQEALPKFDVGELRRDESLRQFGLKADRQKEGEGGHYWIVTGGDVVLFISTQVPSAERESWNPLFEKLMASLEITRDDALVERRIANEVLAELRKRYPDQDFEFDEKGIRGRNHLVYLSNIYREVMQSPKRQSQIIKHFVENMSLSADLRMGEETWEEVQPHILPVLKPRAYIREEGPTQHMLTSEWLVDVICCYAIKRPKLFRFVTGWDVNRWGTDAATLHELALENLKRLPWPRRLEGSRDPDGGRIILVETGDSMTASRLLHPELHKVFSQALGSPFWAGIPDRSTLVLYSDRRTLKKRIARRLKKDHDTSAYPITPRPFLVTADGIAPGPEG
jgi:uncharacterized protein YtpQ (UPF0354 family)